MGTVSVNVPAKHQITQINELEPSTECGILSKKII